MNLAEYQQAVEGLERGEYPETLATLGYTLAHAAAFLAREIRAVAWQSWARSEADALAARATAIAEIAG